MTRLLALLVLWPLIALAQDSVPSLKVKPLEPVFESGRSLYGKTSAKALELRQVPGEFAIFAMQGSREVVQVGDRFGSEQFLVLAITKEKLFFQKRDGFALMFRGKDGKTVIQDIDRADLSPEFLEMAPKPQ